MLSLKNIIYYTMRDLARKPNGITPTRYTTVSATAENYFTAGATGYLTATCTTNSGVTMAPYASIDGEGAGLASMWGITTSGATIILSAPVIKGQRYRVHCVRCSLSLVRIYT